MAVKLVQVSERKPLCIEKKACKTVCDGCHSLYNVLALIIGLSCTRGSPIFFNSLIIKKLKFRSMYEFNSNVLGSGAVRACED